MQRFAHKYLVHLAFAAVGVVAVAIGLALHAINVQSAASSRLVYQTLELIRAIDDVETSLGRAEFAMRALLTTSDNTPIFEPTTELSNLRAAAANLRQLRADDADQQARMRQLDALITERLESFASSGSGLRADATQAIEQVEILARQTRQSELRLLVDRRAEETLLYRQLLLMLAVALLAGLIILVPGSVGFAAQARAREQAERKLADMAEDLPGSVYQCRSHPGMQALGRFDFVSRSVEQLLGLERQALLDDSALFWTCVLADDRAAFEDALAQSATSLQPLRHDFRIVHPQDGQRWIRSTASVRKDTSGSLLWNGYWADITERKRLEDVEHEAQMEGRYRGLLEAAPDAMVVVNELGEIVILNIQAERRFGYSRDELLGQQVTNIIPEGFAERLIADGTRSAAEALAQQIGTGIELSGRRKDGSTFPIEIMLSPLQNAEGTLVTAAIRDISQRKEGEMQTEAAEASNRAKSVFLATMSHEIRTPMNGLLGMVELLGLTKLDPEQHATLEVVRESGKSLQRIIDDILDFSKIEAGKLEVRPEATSIARAVDAVRNIYSGNASDRGLLLTCHVDPRISPSLMVDPMRLRQILNNLVSNAIKFTERGHVRITAELLERVGAVERLRFSVIDDGIGISPQDQARLFQPFMQAASPLAQQFGGTGLGLTICQRLARMMGGDIAMQSAPGSGTTMTLELALNVVEAGAVEQPEAANTLDWLITTSGFRRAAPGLTQARAERSLVLLADDHPTNRSLLQRQVNMLGYAAQSASNGLEALAMWRTGHYGLLITDGNMPAMDGYELARAIRAHESTVGAVRMPIIACTANVLGGEEAICLAAGMDDYLAKPVDLKALSRKLSFWLPLPPIAEHPLDRSALAAISGGETDTEREILNDFRRVNDTDAEKLEEAVGNADGEALRRAAHRIQGACKLVGAMALASVCERLEAAGAANDWKSVETEMAVFHWELERLNNCFEELGCVSTN